jgi:hypothetical protein
MKMLKLRIAAVGLTGVLSLVVVAQDTGSRLVTPSTASVSASEHPRLVSGEAFPFLLQLDPAPRGYEGWGRIFYTFRKADSAFSMGSVERWARGEAELHDGQASYSLSLPITDEMLPGAWILVSVTLGGPNVRTPVSILDNVTFEIPPVPPVMIHIQPPGSARAGHLFTFKITIDEYPKRVRQGCPLALSGVLRSAGLNGRRGQPGEFAVNLNPIELKPDQLSYDMSGSFDPDLPGGPWQGEIRISGSLAPRLLPAPVPGRGPDCPSRVPSLEGDVRFPFTVEPADLVTPISASVIVNPSQIELLLYEADRLKAKVQRLRQQLSSENMAANQALLRDSVKEAMADLDRTEAAYKENEDKGMPPSYAQAVNVFFGDIRLNYREALKFLEKNSALQRQTGPRLVLVNSVLADSAPRLNPALEVGVASILHEAKAYDVLASSKTFYFNLDVFSEPKGATISYRQRGEEYHPLDHETDWRIENLIRAVYLVRLQKPGYEDNVVTFDAIDSTSTSINIHLKRKRGAR